MESLFDIKLIKSRVELGTTTSQGRTRLSSSLDQQKNINEEQFSINQLLQMEKSEIGIHIYEVIQKEDTKYIQLKITDFVGFQNQTRTMIQIIDITGNILHDQQKTQNEFLQMINACVSHDLRNPLNSIKAINIEKKFIYKMLEEAISNDEVTV
jgi:signal transduction histidine kinase